MRNEYYTLSRINDLHLVRGSRGAASRGKVIVIVGEVVVLARTALAFTTRACHGGDTDGVVTHGPRHRGEVRRVRTRAATGAAGGAVGGHLACAQGHQGSWVNTVGRSVGTTGRAGRVRAAVGVLGHGSGKVQRGEAQTGRG